MAGPFLPAGSVAPPPHHRPCLPVHPLSRRGTDAIMTVDENTRLDLRQWFESHMGERLARAVMEAMPPIDYTSLATKSELGLLARELRAEFHLEMARQTRLLVTMQVTTIGTTLAALTALAAFLGT